MKNIFCQNELPQLLYAFKNSKNLRAYLPKASTPTTVLNQEKSYPSSLEVEVYPAAGLSTVEELIRFRIKSFSTSHVHNNMNS